VCTFTDQGKKEDFVGRLTEIMDTLKEIADQLHELCYVDTPREIALGAAAVAAITGDAKRGAFLLEGHYSGEEADGVYDLLEAAARLLEEEEDLEVHGGTREPPDDPGERTKRRDLEGPGSPTDF
jgi:hypothetical protein